MIEHVISAVRGGIDIDGAVTGFPAIDTLKIVEGGVIKNTPDRSKVWVAQTPQAFRANILRLAHRHALADGFVGTDDASLVERIGGMVKLVLGPRDNVKLTVPEDFGAVKAGLELRLQGR
jgi:2-C-methyl-D-erythritol 4-phosphate cytidylyltransferase